MKLIDLKKMTKNVSNVYKVVDELMPIYHSTEEFRVNETDKGTKPIVLSTIGDFSKFIADHKIVGYNILYPLNKFGVNVFIATGEKYVPDVVAPDSNIIFKLVKGKLVPTDNCYIKLYVITSRTNSFTLHTSSGIFSVSIARWKFTAGVKPSYSRVNNPDNNPNYIPAADYDRRTEKLLKSPKVSLNDLRFFHSLFNPVSENFMDVDKAAIKAYGYRVRKDTRYKILKSERFKKIIINELGVLMPSIKKAVKNQISPDKIADMLLKVAKDTVSSDGTTVDDKLKALNAVLTCGYSEEMVSLGTEETTPIAIGRPKMAAPMLNTYDDNDLKDDGTEASIDKMTAEQLDALKEDVGVVPGYTENAD